MAIDEANRHRLYQRLEAVLGPEETAVLMEYLPPVGWADVATKHDLAALEERVALRFDLVDSRFERVDLRFEQIDRRLDQIDARLDQIDARLDHQFGQIDRRLDHQFGQMDSRFAKLESHIDQLRSEFRTSLLAVMSMMVVLVATMIAAVKL